MRKLKMEELGRLSPEAYHQQEKLPVVLVLDNIRSALNVGAAFRTADAFAVEKLYLCGITASPPHREILKTALGATATVEWEYSNDIIEILNVLKKAGYFLAAVEQACNSILLQDFKAESKRKLALVFGNEVEGVSSQALSQMDAAIEIPQFGTKHSLNVAVAIGIVVWETARQLKFNQTT